jgi:hypothetical protein
MKKRHRREELVRLLEQRTEEKLTFRELSDRSGIPVPTLGYWASKLRREQVEGDTNPSLVPVDLVDGPAQGPITVEVGGGVRLHIERDFDAAHLARLLNVLTAQC